MVSTDEDDLWVSPSDTERLTRADARKEKLKREIQAKTGREVSGKDLKQLQKELSSHNDKKIPEANAKDAHSTAPQTKTIDQRAKDDVQTAQDKPDIDTMLDRAQNAQPVSKEEVQSEEG